VDLSNTYLDWTARNLELNSLLSAKHTLLRADALRWLSDAATHTARWDLVVLDPPPFSTSNAMRGTFDVQKDHLRMLRNALTLLTPSGKLYFSTNYRRFQLDERAPALGNFRELTPGILPPDVQRTDVLRCWEVQPPPGGVRESDESKRPSPFGRRPAPASR
jgi:23S rRNA G2069 N7-methylase RlmK/C1962 C5-methylase RlmI